MADPLSSVPARPRTGLRTIAIVVVIAFAAGIAATAWFVRQYRHWLPMGEPPAAAAPPGAPLASAPPPFMPPAELGTAPRPPEEAMLVARINTLAEQLSALEARTALADRAARAAGGNAGKAEALLAVITARRALDRGEGLDYLEPLLRQRFGANRAPEVAAIIAAGRAPVTVAELRLGLDAIAPSLASGVGADGWWKSLQREFSGLIVLHRSSTPSPRPTDRLSRARQQLDAGQVEAALVEVSRLPGAGSAGNWMNAARRYVKARHALDILEMTALTSAAASGDISDGARAK